MKKIILIFTLIILLLTNIQAKEKNNMKDKKVLVVYYSRTDNTKQIAEYIKDATNGDIFRIEDVNPYPDDYRQTTEQAKKEINDGYLPPIKAGISNIQDYDVIFVGSPCWWSTIAPSVSTFLTNYNLSGKIVVPFSTHLGSGLARNASDTAKLTPNSKVLDGKAFRGNNLENAKNEVVEWVNNLKF